MSQMKYQGTYVYAHPVRGKATRQRIEEFVTRSSFINWLSVMSLLARPHCSARFNDFTFLTSFDMLHADLEGNPINKQIINHTMSKRIT